MQASDDLQADLVKNETWLNWHLPEDLPVLVTGCMLALSLLPPGAALPVALWWCFTIIIIRSDLDRFIIPDWASLGIAGMAVLLLWITSVDLISFLESVTEPALRSLAVLLCFWSLARLYKVGTGRDGLGFGDVKLGAAIALWLDSMQLIVAIEVAAIAAIAVALVKGSRNSEFNKAIMPFGAFLAPAGWFVYMSAPFGRTLWPWYMTFVR